MPNTIGFDCAEVCVRGLIGVHERISRIMGTPIAHRDLITEDFYLLMDGRIAEAEYWEALIQKRGWNISTAQCLQAIRENFVEIPGVKPIVRSLKKMGYHLGMLSNHSYEWVADLRARFIVFEYFDYVQFSCEVGVSKPDLRAYILFLKNMGISPEECIFIDDQQSYLKPAAELGMHTIHFTSAPDLILELNSRFNIRV